MYLRSAVLLVGLSLSLAGCGGAGGGIASSPPPQGGTGNGNGGNSGGQAQGNSDLVNLAHDESFTNDAATVSGHYNSSGLASSSVGKATLTIAYDASAKSYTLTTGGHSTTFTPADIDQANSGNGVVVLSKGSDANSETFSYVDNATAASGLRYVGSGLWQHAVQNSSSGDYTASAFTYGIETPNASLPRTGEASYAINVSGVMIWGGEPSVWAGSGELAVNFADGKMLGDGTVYNYDPLDGTTSPDEDFYTSAQISSSANSFSGDFGIGGIYNFDHGTVNGRFYGPSAEEIGATWQVTSSVDNKIAAGTFVGAKDPNGGGNFGGGLATLTGTVVFPTVGYDGSALAIDFDHSTYTLKNGSNVTLGSFDAGDHIADTAFPAFDSYRNSSGGETDTLRMYKWGSANPDVKLTYGSFAEFERYDPAGLDGPGSRTRSAEFLTYGEQTSDILVPHTGTASYSGTLYGTGSDSNQIDPNFYRLTGSGAFTVNFANGTMDWNMSMSGTDPDTAASKNFGSFTGWGTLGMPGTAKAQFSGVLDYTHDIVRPVSGSVVGALFGPNADELVAGFGTDWQDASATDIFAFPYYSLSGVVAAKKN